MDHSAFHYRQLLCGGVSFIRTIPRRVLNHPFHVLGLLGLLAGSALPAFGQVRPGTCAPGSAVAFLDIGNVTALVRNDGGNFFPSSGSFPLHYEVPKGSGMNAHFAESMWIGGFVDGALRVSASTYGPQELWPGPLDTHAGPRDCSAFDRIWEARHVAHGPLDLTPDILEWPVQLGAPYLELDGAQGYTPRGKDRPAIRGDQYLWWITNDTGNSHQTSGSAPLGLEIINEAWAFDREGNLGLTTFYRYTLINKGPSTITDTYIGLFSDIDLGNPWDDAVGSDSTLSLAYVYTNQPSDGTYGSPGPAFGFTLLEASHSRGGLPSDWNAGPSAYMTSVIGPQKGGRNGEWPTTPERVYRFLRGLWGDDGAPMTASGYGWEGSGPTTRYLFHGDPVTGQGWSELNTDGRGAHLDGYDKRVLGSHGPFDLAPGDSASFTFAYVFARGADHLDSVSRLKATTAYLHNVKNGLLAHRLPPNPQFIDANPPESRFPFWVDEPYPNPADDRVMLRMSLKWDAPVSITIHDMLARERLRETSPASPGPMTRTLDVSGWPPGLYVIRVSQRGDHIDWPLIVM